MGNKHLKNAESYFSTSHSDLKPLFSKLKLLNSLNQQLALYLQSPLKNNCQVANLDDKKLTLLASNGSFATELRLLSADLLYKFRKNPELPPIKSIQCIVRPMLPKKESKQSSPQARLSKENAKLLATMAESLDNQKLKAILLKISKHVD